MHKLNHLSQSTKFFQIVLTLLLLLSLPVWMSGCSVSNKGDGSNNQSSSQQLSSKEIKKQVKNLTDKNLADALETLNQLECEWSIIDDDGNVDITNECIYWDQDRKEEYIIDKVKKKWLADKYTLTVKYDESIAKAKQEQKEKEEKAAAAAQAAEAAKKAEEAKQKEEQERAAEEAKQNEEQKKTANQQTEDTSNTNGSSSNDNKTVWITSTGKKYHDEGCRTLSKSKSKSSITIAEAKSQGYNACDVCNPG